MPVGGTAQPCPLAAKSDSESPASDDKYRINIRLLDPFTNGLTDVPYRLTVGGQVWEERSADGWIHKDVDQLPDNCLVEWGEAEIPGTYNYSCNAYLDFDKVGASGAEDHGLHNLGYSVLGSPGEKSRAFRNDYDISQDIGGVLKKWHNDPSQVESRGEESDAGGAADSPSADSGSLPSGTPSDGD